MGVEPTRDRSRGHATVLKTAKPTGTLPPPGARGPGLSIATRSAAGLGTANESSTVSIGTGDRPEPYSVQEDVEDRLVAKGVRGAPVQVGAGLVTLHLAGSHSLKDKRQVVRSLIDRLRRQFNVAIAEVEEQETWQTAVLGVAVVSNEAGHAARQLDRVVEAIEQDRVGVEVVDRFLDVMPVT